jgi:hypothetical protein
MSNLIGYGTPKVTIDLDEYNFLLKKKDELESIGNGNLFFAAKEIIASLINNKYDLSKVSREVSEKGILFSCINLNNISAKSISINLK